MDKEEIIVDFIKGLRIALNTASAYSKDHPYFVKAATEFKQKIDSTFLSLSPIKINIAPASLVIDGKTLEKGMLYADLASFFHLRKVKSIELNPGLSVEEIVIFLSVVSQPIKEILQQGGLDSIFYKTASGHIIVEPLDYSELLRGEGEEVKDLWSYLFAGAVKSGNVSKITGFADNFDKIIRKFRPEDFLQDEELRRNLYSFVSYLKTNDTERFLKCAKSFLEVLLKDNSIAEDKRIGNLKIFFEGLGKDFFSDTIWELIAESKEEESLNFSAFFALVDKITHQDIAAEFHKKMHDTQLLSANPHARKRLHDLIMAEENLMLEPIYRKSLELLTEKENKAGHLSFEHAQTVSGYYCVILNLLSAETDQEKLGLISTRLSKDASVILSTDNIGFLSRLYGVLNRKTGEDASIGRIFNDFLKRISVFAENSIFNMEDPSSIEPLADNLTYSSLGYDSYLQKIFEEGRINRHILKLMLRLFPQDYGFFLDNLEKKKGDIDFFSRLITASASVDSAQSLEILKKIYYFSSNILKVEVLKTMQGLNFQDEDFLLAVLKNDEITLKEEALKTLVKTENTKKDALSVLFAKPKMQSLIIAQDLNLREAAPYILSISRLWFFWNRALREKARQILRSWNVT
ncbi:MAG: hypothetical protein WC417_04035 [Candidatus Omnitrophota bacterium]|jgi:hypothetical protein